MKPVAHLVADLGFLNSFGRNIDLRKGVHGPLDWIAFDAWHRIEDFLCQTGLESQGIQDCVPLLHNKKEYCISFTISIYHPSVHHLKWHKATHFWKSHSSLKSQFYIDFVFDFNSQIWLIRFKSWTDLTKNYWSHTRQSRARLQGLPTAPKWKMTVLEAQ